MPLLDVRGRRILVRKPQCLHLACSSRSGPAPRGIPAAAFRCPFCDDIRISGAGPAGCTVSDRRLTLFGHHPGGDAPMRPCVRSATLDGYVHLARSLGLDPIGLMTSVGLDVADLAAPEKWIPAGDVATLLQLSADRSGHEDFGLLLAGRRRLSTLGPLSVVLSQEPDLRSALRLLNGYERSYNEALHLRLDEANGLATIRLWLEFGEPVPVHQSLDLATAALHGIIRELLGRGWEPLSVCFAHPRPATLDAYHEVFGPRLTFDHSFTGLVFIAEQLDARNTMSDPLLQPYARQFLKSMPAPRGATVADQVRELVDVFLPLSRCSTLQVARSLGVTQRTLHRH